MGCPDEEKPVCCVQQKRFGLFAVLGLLRRGVRRDKGLSGMNAAILLGRGGGRGVIEFGQVPGYPAGMNTQAGVVMTTFPDELAAVKVLDGLLEARLAACIQTVPIQSAYRWKGAVQRESEILALIKTQVALYPEVEAYLRAVHPYETPEIILLPIDRGLPAYLAWLTGETKPGATDPVSAGGQSPTT